MRSLTDSEREDYFPVHIPLGREMDMPMMDGKRGKKEKIYPRVYIDRIPGLEQLPKEGCMLVEFRRKRLSIDENAEGDETSGVELELHVLCLPKEYPGEAAKDLASAFTGKPEDEEGEMEYEDEDEDEE